MFRLKVSSSDRIDKVKVCIGCDDSLAEGIAPFDECSKSTRCEKKKSADKNRVQASPSGEIVSKRKVVHKLEMDDKGRRLLFTCHLNEEKNIKRGPLGPPHKRSRSNNLSRSTANFDLPCRGDRGKLKFIDDPSLESKETPVARQRIYDMNENENKEEYGEKQRIYEVNENEDEEQNGEIQRFYEANENEDENGENQRTYEVNENEDEEENGEVQGFYEANENEDENGEEQRFYEVNENEDEEGNGEKQCFCDVNENEEEDEGKQKEDEAWSNCRSRPALSYKTQSRQITASECEGRNAVEKKESQSSKSGRSSKYDLKAHTDNTSPKELSREISTMVLSREHSADTNESSTRLQLRAKMETHIDSASGALFLCRKEREEEPTSAARDREPEDTKLQEQKERKPFDTETLETSVPNPATFKVVKPEVKNSEDKNSGVPCNDEIRLESRDLVLMESISQAKASPNIKLEPDVQRERRTVGDVADHGTQKCYMNFQQQNYEGNLVLVTLPCKEEVTNEVAAPTVGQFQQPAPNAVRDIHKTGPLATYRCNEGSQAALGVTEGELLAEFLEHGLSIKVTDLVVKMRHRLYTTEAQDAFLELLKRNCKPEAKNGELYVRYGTT